MKELRWGRGWSILPSTKLNIILRSPRENIRLSRNILIVLPPEGRSYIPMATVLQGISNVKEGMTKEEVKRIVGMGPLPELEKKLAELDSAPSRVVLEKLGEPLYMEPYVFQTPWGRITVDRWTYSCRSVTPDAEALCYFYVSFYGDIVVGWLLTPIDKGKLVEAERRFMERTIIRRVRFKSDAVEVLGSPYWKIRNMWYYPVPEAPENVLVEVSFVFGAWDLGYTSHLVLFAEGSATGHGIEVFGVRHW